MSCAVWFEAEDMITTYSKGMFSGKALASATKCMNCIYTQATYAVNTFFFHQPTISESESKYFFLPV